MSHLALWNAWRLAVLPYIESVTGKSATTIARRSRPGQFTAVKRPRQVRHVAYIQSGASEVPLSSEVNYVHKEIKDRKIELDAANIEQYPRIKVGNQPALSVSQFIKQYTALPTGETVEKDGKILIAGRISSLRKSGAKLAFVDLVEEPGHQKLQLMLNLASMESVERKQLSDYVRLIRRGDVLSAVGHPCRTASGELSLRVTQLPTVLSPCLHTIPIQNSSNDTPSEIELLDRHVDMLVNPSMVDTLVVRSEILKSMRKFFDERSFHEVQTPILAAAAGGATARPFTTAATEFSDRKLALRIAPELWLKRLILGGMPKVFEIGPSFRNEGLDKTHNPEFTTCEFYATYHALKDLQAMTEQLLRNILESVKSHSPSSTSAPNLSSLSEPFKEIDFIPAINAHIPRPLPNLSSPAAHSEIVEIFKAQSIPLPSKPTLPRLLDKLCSHYLEPTCTNPTWIFNIPECLSPLAKSFIHPTAPNSQPVAARAELFIKEREIVNCYEEENSPFEQRRKFIDQQWYAVVPGDSSSKPLAGDVKDHGDRDEEAMKLDEDYLRALEWGLPPTGGWGCGVDRLVMFFTGKERIGDVLSFGNLRAVTRGADKWSDKAKDDSGKS